MTTTMHDHVRHSALGVVHSTQRGPPCSESSVRMRKDLCDAHLRPSRRDMLRVGGAGMLGLSLGSLLKLQAAQAAGRRRGAAAGGGPGWGKAKSIIMVYLQGGPSHLDLWDPKPDAAENIRSAFKNIGTKLPGVHFTEILPKLAADQRPVHDDPLDELHAQRPVQPHGRHLPDDDRLHDRQGQPLRPARAAQRAGLPQLRLANRPAAAADRADAAVRHAAAAAAGEQRRRQGRLGRLPGQGVRPVHALPRRRRHGHEQDGPHQGRRPQDAARRVRRPPGAPREAARR